MKKLLIVLFIFWGAIGLTACTGALYGRNGTALSDEDIANDRMTEIIEAIENKDQEKNERNTCQKYYKQCEGYRNTNRESA